MLPLSDDEASLFQATQERVHAVGVDGHDVAGHLGDTFHERVAVLGSLAEQMQGEQRQDRLGLHRPAKDGGSEEGVLSAAAWSRRSGLALAARVAAAAGYIIFNIH